jgi:hypothetical protein
VELDALAVHVGQDKPCGTRGGGAGGAMGGGWCRGRHLTQINL